MKTDHELRIDVLEGLRWEPLLKQQEIGVHAHAGIITLSGIVSSYIKKLQAAETAKKINGVKAVIEKIEVRFNNGDEKTDNELAVAVLYALRSNRGVPFDQIKAEVEDGHVTLDGIVNWKYQKEAAQSSVSGVDGIKVLTNRITVEAESADDIEKAGIEQAIARNWAMNDLDVHVYVSGNKVTLTGVVHSYYQKEEAERMAWNAPGVWTVNNELLIDQKEYQQQEI
jgi:osmotically-inducible protein OsmY